MKRVSCILLLLGFSCSVKTSNNKENSKVVQEQKNDLETKTPNNEQKSYQLEGSSIKIDSIEKNEFKMLSSKSKDFLDSHTNIQKLNDNIRIVNRTGAVVREYQDSLADTDDTDQKMYRVIGEFKKKGIVVLSVQYYETGECILVDSKTGKETIVWGIPKLSMDGKYLFIGTCALGYDEIMPNGFQIWEFQENNNLKLLHEMREKEWCINEFYWVGNNTLAIETKRMSGEKSYLRLSF